VSSLTRLILECWLLLAPLQEKSIEMKPMMASRILKCSGQRYEGRVNGKVEPSPFGENGAMNFLVV